MKFGQPATPKSNVHREVDRLELEFPVSLRLLDMNVWRLVHSAITPIRSLVRTGECNASCPVVSGAYRPATRSRLNASRPSSCARHVDPILD